jgi:hypothetical protein
MLLAKIQEMPLAPSPLRPPVLLVLTRPFGIRSDKFNAFFVVNSEL